MNSGQFKKGRVSLNKGKRLITDTAKLKELYLNQKLSLKSIATIFKCDDNTVMRKLGDLNIQRRSPTEHCLGSKHAGTWSDSSKQQARERIINRLKSGELVLTMNKAEKKIMQLIKKNKLPYKYTGNGKFWIENVNPDFVNVDGEKKVIELYGCFWHACPSCNLVSAKLGGTGSVRKAVLTAANKNLTRQATFDRYGYEAVIVWEHELKNPEWQQNLLKKLAAS